MLFACLTFSSSNIVFVDFVLIMVVELSEFWITSPVLFGLCTFSLLNNETVVILALTLWKGFWHCACRHHHIILFTNVLSFREVE